MLFHKAQKLQGQAQVRDLWGDPHPRYSFPTPETFISLQGWGGERELLPSPSSGTSPHAAPGAGRELVNEIQFMNYLQEPQADPCLLTHGFRVLSRLRTLRMN